MPYSSNSGKFFCDRAVMRITSQLSHALFESHRILDVGAGSGTYSDRYGKTYLDRVKFKWTGVEIWEPYVAKFGLESKYDTLIVGDAIEHLITESKRMISYDLCFMGDVVEHVSKEAAIKMVELALKCCNAIILSIPIIHYPQEAYDGNPYEKHVKDDWSHQEVMETFGNVVVEYGVENEIGVYVLSTRKTNLLKDVLRPQVACYSICKNEEHFIERFYESIQDADFIAIVDTGSTDSTFDKLVSFVYHRTEQHGHEEEFKCDVGADLQGGIHSIRIATDGAMQVMRAWIHPWRFDDARNIALCSLPEDPDVCISIDIDELLEPGWKEVICAAVLDDLHRQGKPADRYNHRFSTIWNWQNPEQAPNFTDHWHERIHSRKGYFWKLPVHEILVKDGPEQMRWLQDLKMIQKPDLSKSRSSYLTLLERSLKEEPNRWKLWSFYASDLQGVNRFDDALLALNKAKTLPDADKAFLSFQCSNIYKHLGNHSKAIAEMLIATTESTSREYRVWLARLYRDLNKPREALNSILMAAEVTERTQGYSYDPTCWGQQFDDLVEQLTAECKL